MELTEVQIKLQRYYIGWADCELVKTGKPGSVMQKMEKASENVWDKDTVAWFNSYIENYTAQNLSELCQIFKTAVETGNSKKIIEIGEGIEFLRTLQNKHFDGQAGGDKWRREILYLKSVLDVRRESWPISKLAKEIGWPESEKENGFPNLRKLCKENKFPLCDSSQTSLHIKA